MTTATHEDSSFVAIIRWSTLLLLVLTLAAGALFSTRAALGVCAGGCIAIGNFVWIRAMLGKIIATRPNHPERHAGISLVARLTITGIALYLLLRSGSVSIPGLLCGLSIILVSLAASQCYGAAGRPR